MEVHERAEVHEHRIEVPAVTIDGFVARTGVKPDVLKIDAEGAELEILMGMERTLAEIRPTLTLEMGDIEGTSGMIPSRKAVDHLLARGYRAMEWSSSRNGGGLVEHRALEHYPYTNLIFVPR